MYYNYDVSRYPFKTVLEKVFGNTLQALSSDIGLVSQRTDQSSEWHKAFYGMPDDSEFFSIYRKWMLEEIISKFKEPHYFQAKPTFRVHLPNNLAVGEFHRDSDYNHSPHELNIFVPLTPAFDTNSIWLETKIGSDTYLPLEVEYGEYVFFDGANLRHGNHVNKTGQTRVSFDCRIIPVSKYSPTALNTLGANKKFILGEYWAD